MTKETWPEWFGCEGWIDLFGTIAAFAVLLSILWIA
jgi:hypothetical protein